MKTLYRAPLRGLQQQYCNPLRSDAIRLSEAGAGQRWQACDERSEARGLELRQVFTNWFMGQHRGLRDLVFSQF